MSEFRCNTAQRRETEEQQEEEEEKEEGRLVKTHTHCHGCRPRSADLSLLNLHSTYRYVPPITFINTPCRLITSSDYPIDGCHCCIKS